MAEYALGIDLTSLSISMTQTNPKASGWESNPVPGNGNRVGSFGRLSGVTEQLLENYLTSFRQHVVYTNAAALGSADALKLMKKRLSKMLVNRMAFAHPVLWPMDAVDELARKVSDSFVRSNAASRGTEPIPVAAPWAATLGWSLRQSVWKSPLDLLVLTTGMQEHVELTIIHAELSDGILSMVPRWFHSSSPEELQRPPEPLLASSLRCDFVVATSPTAVNAWEHWKHRLPTPRRGVAVEAEAVAEGCSFIAGSSGGGNVSHPSIRRARAMGRIPLSIGVIGRGENMEESVWYRLNPHQGERRIDVLHSGKVPAGLVLAAVPAARSLMPHDWLLIDNWETVGLTMMGLVHPKQVDMSNSLFRPGTLTFTFDDAGTNDSRWSYSQVKAQYTGSADET